MHAPAALLCCAGARTRAASGARDAQPPPLTPSPRGSPRTSLLIAIATAGERLVAVGDRGIVVLSDDKGGSWVQAAAVPTQALLTGCASSTRSMAWRSVTMR